ncbi:MAG: hypothetical protein Q9N67_03000 [Ghiorsea sp.]|nr:hypothetical protein [Ghiorsea sp.]
MKNIFLTSMFLGVVGFGAVTTQAFASPGFEITLNQQLGNGASVSCNACHSGATNSATATFPMANTYRAARTANDYTLIATSDSDNDGFSNKQEVNGTATDFNVAATTPFTLASGGIALANVYVTGDNNAD